MSQFSLNYKHILMDEIALNGLEGINFSLLWKQTEKRISSPVTNKMKDRFWNFIVNSKSVNFYQIPEPYPCTELYDRYMFVDDSTGQLLNPPDYLDGPYKFQPAENGYGSAIYLSTRKNIPQDQLQNSYESVFNKYGETLMIVACIEERWKALALHKPIICLSQLTPVHYCILELIGRGRENGQMTTGKTNLTKIVKDPKVLFYNRKHLQNLDFVRVQSVTQITGDRGTKSLLLRLPRFHKPNILSGPKIGRIHDLTEYLLKQPDYSASVQNLIKTGIVTQQHCKKLQKTINMFQFEEREASPTETPKKPKKHFTSIKEKVVVLNLDSGESSQSDDEGNEESAECQYKVGVNILRQAYERFMDAGLEGVTQNELAQMLGIEFYLCRTVCRIFMSKNLIREFFVAKGKQRTKRYIAATANGETDANYEREKQKFLEYLNESQRERYEALSSPTTSTMHEDNEVPRKRIRLDRDGNNGFSENRNSIEDNLEEVSMIEGLEKFHDESFATPKKKPTLRQLKFANGIIKVTREKISVAGYQTLSTLVSKEINEPPLDTKPLKLAIQKLITDKQLKMFKLKWPGNSKKYTALICAPHVKATDQMIKAKYNEITMTAISNKKLDLTDTKPNITRPLSLHAYPRYMKIQKLHEVLTQIIFFGDEKGGNDLPPGFGCLLDIIPHLTVGFAVGNISNTSSRDISNLKMKDSLLNVKLCDAPHHVYNTLLQSKSLQSSLRSNLKVLAMFGLIQLVGKPIQPIQTADTRKSVLSYMFYVNRKAKIINTTGVWPREGVDLKSLEQTFEFKTFEDVENYWNAVFNISIKTKVLTKKRVLKKLTPPERLETEVEQNDNGQILGDGKGPCGFDACFFMEIERLWNVFSTNLTKVKQPVVKREIISRFRIPKKQKKAPKIKKIPLWNASEVPNKRKRKRLSDTSVKWTPFEDNILMMCKAAITVLCPVSQAGSLQIRNSIAKDILSMYDPNKTASICHKRATYLESDVSLSYENKRIINELRRRHHLIQKYEGLLKKYRIRNSSKINKLVNETRLPMFEVVWIISQIMKSKVFNQNVPCVAMSYQDFHENFLIAPTSANKPYNIYQSASEGDPKRETIKEGILLSTILHYADTLSPEASYKIYYAFKTYPEMMMRGAVDQLRKSGAISAKEKVLNSHMHKFTLKDIMIRCSYKLSASYRRKWSVRLNSEFSYNLSDVLESDIPENNVKGSSEINCLLCELHSCDVLEILSVTVPVISGTTGSLAQEEQLNVIDIENKYKLKSGLLGWKNKCGLEKLSDIYKDLDVKIDDLSCIYRNAVTEFPEEKPDFNDELITYLKGKRECGSTFDEIQVATGCDTKTLTAKLTNLETKLIIKRVGFYENLIILTEYVQPWVITLNHRSIIPEPWLTLQGGVHIDIFMKWTSVVMNKIFENPGCSLRYLADSCEYLTARGAQAICVYLNQIECITLRTVAIKTPDLFTDDDIEPEISDFNPFASPSNIIAIPVKDCLTRFSYVRKKNYRNIKCE